MNTPARRGIENRDKPCRRGRAEGMERGEKNEIQRAHTPRLWKNSRVITSEAEAEAKSTGARARPALPVLFDGLLLE